MRQATEAFNFLRGMFSNSLLYRPFIEVMDLTDLVQIKIRAEQRTLKINTSMK